jgi:DNA-binding GntR family transcriptional regulator
MLSLGSISIAELTESRLHIQDLVVRLACERATRADLDALEANIDETERVTAAGRYLERVECSREFYRLLVACAHNQVLAMMVRSVTEILMQFVYGRVAAGGKPQPELVEKRRAFLAALRARDAELATRLMRTHLASVHRLLEPVRRRLGRAAAGRRPAPEPAPQHRDGAGRPPFAQATRSPALGCSTSRSCWPVPTARACAPTWAPTS